MLLQGTIYADSHKEDGFIKIRLNLLSEFAKTVVVKSPERDPFLRRPEMCVFHLVLSYVRD